MFPTVWYGEGSNGIDQNDFENWVWKLHDTWLFPLITSIIKSIKLEYYIVGSGAGEVATGAGGEEKRRGDGSDGQG